MRKIVTLTAATALALAVGFSGAAKAEFAFPFDSDLVSYYPLDEGSGTTATDVADANDGTIVGAAFTGGGADAPSIPGNVDALRFDGDGDEVDVPDATNLDFASTDDLTISLWAKREETHANRDVYHLLGKRVACGSMNYQLARDGGDNLHFNSDGGILSAGVDISLDTWAHIAVTYDSGTTTARIYVDGVLKNTNASYTLGSTNGAAVKIGTSGTCPNIERFIGVIDDVRIYDVALNADEIALLATQFTIDKTLVSANDDDGNNDDIVDLGEEIEFVMKVTVTNLGPATLTGLMAKDPLPGDLQLDNNDTCDDAFAVHSGDGTVGTVSTQSKGRTKKCFVNWNIGDLTSGQIAMLTITASTDENPGRGKNAPHQEFTSEGTYCINQGASLKGTIDSGDEEADFFGERSNGLQVGFEDTLPGDVVEVDHDDCDPPS